MHRFVWHDRKAWWQQEQAILAYLILQGCLDKADYRKHGREAAAFYNAGQGCSFGNAGWIVPSFSAPLPAPGVGALAVQALFEADSPLQLQLRLGTLPAKARWLWRFWRHCKTRDHQRGMPALARLNPETMRGFDALATDGVDFEMHHDGVLFAFLDARRMAVMHAQLRAIAGYGHAVPEVLRGDALRAREPALGDASSVACTCRPSAMSGPTA